jgi:hypothetical protein
MQMTAGHEFEIVSSIFGVGYVDVFKQRRISMRATIIWDLFGVVWQTSALDGMFTSSPSRKSFRGS